MIKILPYNLPDFEIFESIVPVNRFYCWIPDRTIIVLGLSNSAEISLIINNVLNDNIPVYKRPSGGQAVVLTPSTMVLSTLIFSDTFENPKNYFITINDKIIQVLNKLGINKFSHQGISDIAINNKKILGSSIYRKSAKVFYHAVLNVSEDSGTFERYLHHPEKEPDYRKGRNHNEFVTSLKEQGYILNMNFIKDMFSETTFLI